MARNGTGEGPRRGDHLEACRNALGSWRLEIWTRRQTSGSLSRVSKSMKLADC